MRKIILFLSLFVAYTGWSATGIISSNIPYATPSLSADSIRGLAGLQVDKNFLLSLLPVAGSNVNGNITGWSIASSNYSYVASNLLWQYTTAVSNSVIVTSNALNGSLTASNDLWVYTTSVSNLVLTTSNALYGLAGDAFLSHTQTFTGSNTFSARGFAAQGWGYSTNAVTTGNDTVTMDMLKPYQSVATNIATVTLQLANVPTTDVRASTLYLSNSANTLMTITLPAGMEVWTNGVKGSGTIYLTNLLLGILSVECYGPGLTNGVFVQ